MYNKKKYYLCIAFNKRHRLFAICLAELAQLVEQRIRNAWVGGSSPPFGSNMRVCCSAPSYCLNETSGFNTSGTMLIYNTTFQVSTDNAQHLVVYLHEKYIPEALHSGIMRHARMSRILSHRDPDSECFSVQFEVEDMALLHKWYSTDGVRLNNEMSKLFKNDAVSFPTMMEVIE